jgi:hypothetical protein
MAENAPSTIRDHIVAALDSAEDIPAPTTGAVEASKAEPSKETAAPLADRPRDDQGRFAPRELPKAPEASAAPAPLEQPKATNRPSAWKKEMWEHWDRLDPSVQAYLQQREQEYQRGVSAYKNEWEQARPFTEAVQPFLPILQQHGIRPENWIRQLGMAHQILALGQPHEKVEMFRRLMADYQVPLEALQGGPQDAQAAQQYQSMHPVIERLMRVEGTLTNYLTSQEQAAQAATLAEVESFSKDKEHFEAVRETMAGLLQSGVADDLQGAYDKALRLHDDLWRETQAKAQQAEADRIAQEKAAKVVRARANAVSPKSATPGDVAKKPEGKGLRSAYSEAFGDLGGRV